VPRFASLARAFVVLFLLGGCASLSQHDPPQVNVVGIESLPGEGLEMRMLVKLRVQNPNDAPIDYDGVYLKFLVQDRTLATGVSDAHGTVPRFGEEVLTVPVVVSMGSIVRQVLGAMDAKAAPPDRIRYSLEGKLHGPGFSSLRFESRGDLELPAAGAPTQVSTPP
jgi:LEA14-like dessication related protein